MAAPIRRASGHPRYGQGRPSPGRPAATAGRPGPASPQSRRHRRSPLDRTAGESPESSRSWRPRPTGHLRPHGRRDRRSRPIPEAHPSPAHGGGAPPAGCRQAPRGGRTPFARTAHTAWPTGAMPRRSVRPRGEGLGEPFEADPDGCVPLGERAETPPGRRARRAHPTWRSEPTAPPWRARKRSSPPARGPGPCGTSCSCRPRSPCASRTARSTRTCPCGASCSSRRAQLPEGTLAQRSRGRARASRCALKLERAKRAKCHPSLLPAAGRARAAAAPDPRDPPSPRHKADVRNAPRRRERPPATTRRAADGAAGRRP